jgi:hypothetical protein
MSAPERTNMKPVVVVKIVACSQVETEGVGVLR